MIVVNPIAIDETNFIGSSIAEPDLRTGEKEYVATPFDGYDISSNVSSADGIVKDRLSESYAVLNKSTKKVHWFNRYFSPTVTTTALLSNQRPYSIGSAPETWGLPSSGGTLLYISNEGLSTEVVSIELLIPHDPDLGGGSSSLNNAVDEYRAAGGVFNPIAHSVIDNPSGSGVLVYVLNNDGGTYSVVGLNNGPSGAFVFENLVINSSRTPVSIDCRRGKFSLLFSNSSESSISFFNSTFSSEQSNHLLSGSQLEKPCNGFTIDEIDGYKLIKSTNKTIYNINSNYQNGSDYVKGDQVIKAAIHKKYQCLITTTTDPEDGVDLVPPTWLLLGETNKWAMFDGINTYPSKADIDITVELRPIGVTNAVNVFTMANCKEVTITSSLPDAGETYTVTHNTSGKFDLVDFDLPPYENPLIEVTFTPEDGLEMSVGELVVGEATRIGVLLSGAISDRIDYSRYDYDEFGNLTFIKRPIVKYNTYPIRVMKQDAPGVELYLDEVSGKQAVWIGYIGNGDYLIARGNLERSPMTYNNPSIVEYAIKVRGSI